MERKFKKCLRCSKEFLSNKDHCWKCNGYFQRLKTRKERKKKHLCYDCGKNVEPVYPVRCSCCNHKKVTNI
jgi:hypothetical protein